MAILKKSPYKDVTEFATDTHDGLAEWVRYMQERWYGKKAWTNMLMYGVRPDVFAIEKTLDYKKCEPTTFEIKVSRADFLCDIRAGKWEGYRKFSQRIVFVAPQGLIQLEEIPSDCGFREFVGRELVIRKPAKKLNDWNWCDRLMMKLILGEMKTEKK